MVPLLSGSFTAPGPGRGRIGLVSAGSGWYWVAGGYMIRRACGHPRTLPGRHPVGASRRVAVREAGHTVCAGAGGVTAVSAGASGPLRRPSTNAKAEAISDRPPSAKLMIAAM
jgi:hypothetical protein